MEDPFVAANEQKGQERDAEWEAQEAAERAACPACGGDGVIVVGWDADAYENIEGPCPECRPVTQPNSP